MCNNCNTSSESGQGIIQTMPPCYFRTPKNGDVLVQIDRITGEPILDLFHERLTENRTSPPEYERYEYKGYGYDDKKISRMCSAIVLITIVLILFFAWKLLISPTT